MFGTIYHGAEFAPFDSAQDERSADFTGSNFLKAPPEKPDRFAFSGSGLVSERCTE